jgi:hypothetical protein
MRGDTVGRPFRLRRRPDVATGLEESETLDAIKAGESLESIALRMNKNRGRWRHVLGAIEKMLEREDPYWGLSAEEQRRADRFVSSIRKLQSGDA